MWQRSLCAGTKCMLGRWRDDMCGHLRTGVLRHQSGWEWCGIGRDNRARSSAWAVQRWVWQHADMQHWQQCCQAGLLKLGWIMWPGRLAYLGGSGGGGLQQESHLSDEVSISYTSSPMAS